MTVALAGTAGSQSGDGSYDLKVTSGTDVLVLEADVASGTVDATSPTTARCSPPSPGRSNRRRW
ncbi:MAG: hypothetical protein R2882_13655 [Gemmatimonadales bacterium]